MPDLFVQVRVGPDSVGAFLLRDALVFGGDVLTCTDVAVASGHAKIGEFSLDIVVTYLCGMHGMRMRMFSCAGVHLNM